MAVTCGLTVANLYYSQPLLGVIGQSFHVSQDTASVVVTATQIGYALAMAFVLPLGDLLENRALASRTLFGTAVALVLAAVLTNFAAFLAVAVLIGITSVVAQILIPFAAHLAPPAQRGRYVGQVMSGLLLGILLARTVSSLIAAAFGWRTVYWLSAVLMLVLAAGLRFVLPRREPEHTGSYGSLLISVGQIFKRQPVLRRRALAQALNFAAFSAFWTSVAYQLVDQLGLTQVGVGIFALVGAGGAAAAPLAGWAGDRGWGSVGRLLAISLGILAAVLAGLSAHHLIPLAVAGVLLDLAVQGHQVLSQRDIYALEPTARARINTVFMTSVFLGGAVGSAVAGLLYARAGWTAVTIFAGAAFIISSAIWAAGRLRGDVGQPAVA